MSAKARGWERVPLLPGHTVYARGAWRIQKQSNGWRWWYVIQYPLVRRSPRGVAKTLRKAMNDVDFEIREGGEPTPHEQPNATVPQLESDRREDVTPSNGDRK